MQGGNSQGEDRRACWPAAEAGDYVDDLSDQPAVIGDRLAVEFELIEVLIERDRRFDAGDDDNVTDFAVETESDQRGVRPRRRYLRLLQVL